MKRTIYILLLSILLTSFSLKAQIVATLQQPPPFQFSIESLWKVTLNNPGDLVRVYLFAEVKRGDSVIVDATTSTFNLPGGTKLVNASDLSPIDVDEHGNTEVKNTLTRTGTLQSGVYTICISVISDSSGAQIGGNGCSNVFEIINATRMELLLPEDEEEVLLLLPNFTWLPPTPPPPGKTIFYQFQIVEILNLQSAEYAFLANPIYFHSNNINSILFQYPIAARPLVNGKRYAWKVVAYIDNKIFIESPVREFRYNGNNRDNEVTNKKIRENIKDEMSVLEIMNEFGSSGKMGVSKMRSDLQEELPLPKSLSVEVDYEHDKKAYVNSEIPKNFSSVNVDIEGSPFNVNLYYDTKQNELKQTINSLGLAFDPKALKEKVGQGSKNNKGNRSADNPLAKFFSFFDTFGLGDTYPEYTSSTVNGVKLIGANIAINPGLFYFAISGINNLDAIPNKTFSRKMLAGSIGIGGKDKSHFHINMMRAWDNSNSIDVTDPSIFITPMDNIILGTEGSFNLFNNQFSIKGEINGSILTRDKTAPELDRNSLPDAVKDIPDFIYDFIDPNTSTQYDLMYEVSSKYKSAKIGTDAEISFRSVGAGYVSLGAPNVRQDLQTLKFKISNPFLKKRVIASVYYKVDKNNLSNLNSTTSTSKGLGVNLKVNFQGYPYLLVDYRPNSVTNDAGVDSLYFKNNSNVLSVATGMNLMSKAFINSVNLVVSNISSSSQSAFNNYSNLNINLSNSLSFMKIPLTITGSAGYTKNKTILSYNSFLFDLSAAYSFTKKLVSSLGASYYTEEALSTKSSIYLNSSYTLNKFLSLNFNLIKDFYSEETFQYGNIDNLVIRAGISSTIK